MKLIVLLACVLAAKGEATRGSYGGAEGTNDRYPKQDEVASVSPTSFNFPKVGDFDGKKQITGISVSAVPAKPNIGYKTLSPAKPEVQSPKPKVQSPRPEIQSPKPNVQSPKPKVQSPKPITQSFSPKPITSDDGSAKTIRYENEVNNDGHNYFFETTNGITAQAKFAPLNYGNPPKPGISGQGYFSWTSPEGKFIEVHYTADENGYQPSSDALPVPSPQLARALAYGAQYLARIKN